MSHKGRVVSITHKCNVKRSQIATQKKQKMSRKRRTKRKSNLSHSKTWSIMRGHIHKGTRMVMFQNKKRKRKEMEEKSNRLYQVIPDVPPRKLSFYAENILIQTLDRNKMLTFPDLGLLQAAKRPISEMTIRAKHINFLLCACSGYLARIKRYIIEDLVDINWTFVNGNNCLHEAILGNKLQVFDFILQIDYIDFDYPNAFGWTPLSLAAFKRNY